MDDLDRIKRNVAKMASQNAPEADIDGYIASEGVTLNQVKNHKSSMGWGEVATTAVSNIPASAARFGGAIVDAVAHPVDTVKTLADVGYGAGSKVVGAAANAVGIDMDQEAKAKREASFDAVANFYAERYGGVENFKKALAEDPVGVAADLGTVLSGGSSLASRIPGVSSAVSKAGRLADSAAAATGKLEQPLRATGKASAAVARGILNPVEGAVRATSTVANKIGAPVIGMMTGVGAVPVRAAAKAGYQGNGAFLEAMRGNKPVSDSIDAAKSAVSQLHNERSAAYKANMAATNPQVVGSLLSGRPIVQAINNAKGKVYFNGVAKDVEAAKVVADIEAKFGEFYNLPHQQFRTVEGFDALKQSIGEIRQRTQPRTLARNVADQVYNEVKATIVQQAPSYAKAMRDYASASDKIDDISRTFSLGEKAAPDTTARKLLSVMRDNVNTNYGNRTRLMEELATKQPDLIPAIAGHTMSSGTPRGLQALGATGAGIAGITHLNPYMIAALPFMSPRLMGEAAYGTGRAARMIESMSRKTGLSKEQLAQILLGTRAAGEIGQAAER